MEAQLAEPEALARLVTLLPAGATAASAAAGAEGGAGCPAVAKLDGCCYWVCGPVCGPKWPHEHGALRTGWHSLTLVLLAPCEAPPAPSLLPAGDGEQLQSLLAPLLRLLQRSPRLAVELAQVGAAVGVQRAVSTG